MTIEGVQIRVKFPQYLYDELNKISEAAGVTMADLVRLAVVEWFRRINEGRGIVSAYRSGVVTTEEQAGRLQVLAERAAAEGG